MQFDRLVPLLAAAATDGKKSDEIVETGIKVIDVMCPIRAGGSVAIAGENGAGSTVVMEEIVRRISKGPHSVTMFMPSARITSALRWVASASTWRCALKSIAALAAPRDRRSESSVIAMIATVPPRAVKPIKG